MSNENDLRLLNASTALRLGLITWFTYFDIVLNRPLSARVSVSDSKEGIRHG